MTELIWDLQRFATATAPKTTPAEVIADLGINETDAAAAAAAVAGLEAGDDPKTIVTGVAASMSGDGALEIKADGDTILPLNAIFATTEYAGDDAMAADGSSAKVEGLAGYKVNAKKISIDLSASAADNTVAMWADNSNIVGGSGTDAFQITGNNAVITVTEGNNKALIFGDNGAIEAGEGNDTLSASGSHSTIVDAGGDNALYIDGASSFAELGGGNDTVDVGAGTNITVSAGSGDNVIRHNGTGRVYYNIAEDSNNDITKFAYDTKTASDVLVLNSADVALGVVEKNLVVTSDSSSVTLGSYSSANTKVQWTTADSDVIYAAKVATGSAATFKYESDVDQYFGTGDVDTVTLSSSDADTSKVSIWMAGTNLFTGAKTADYVDIDVIDASKVGAGQNITIAGSESQNTIKGGNGAGSIWGGFGNEDDVLTGGKKSALTFVAGNGEGNDVINSNSASDTVKFWNANVSDVASIDTSAGSVVEFNMTGGNTITVNTAKGFTVEAADGTKWNYSNGEFTQK